MVIAELSYASVLSRWIARSLSSGTEQIHLYEIARRKASDWKRIDQKTFRSPGLSINDLVRSDNLVRLLNSRLTYHPRVFHHIDGPGVPTGLFCGSLPELSCDSRLRLNLTNEDYSFLWGREGFCNSATILYQLEAQYQLYCFLQICVKLPSVQVDTPRVEPNTEEVQSQLSCSLIAQLTWTNYIPTGHIDLLSMINLLDCSLQDTRNDLYDLRMDANLWSTRITARTPNRCTVAFLRETYNRIDCFDQLKMLVASLPQDDPSCSAPSDTKDDKHLGYVALEVALKSTMNKIASSLRKGMWLKCLKDTAFAGLIDLILKQHTIVWIIGYEDMLKAIDREVKRDKSRASVPSDVMRALRDMSVMAYCLSKTQKAVYFENLEQRQYFSQVGQDSGADWAVHTGLWSSLARDTLDSMGESTLR